MRLVPRPDIRPSRCAAIPFIGQSSNCRWVDTGTEMPGFDNHIYLSEPAVREAGVVLGFPTVEEHDEAKARIEALEREVDDLREQLAEADRELNAVHVLKNNRAWSQSQRPGRPKQKEAA